MTETIEVYFPNWRKYQRALKGGTRHRNWFAVNVHIGHDPEFMSLTIPERYGWFMLLSEAALRGKELDCGGVVLKLCLTLFRKQFGLRSNYVLDPYVNHGFIHIGVPTEHNITVHNSTEQKEGEKPPKKQTKPAAKSTAKKPKGSRECPKDFVPSDKTVLAIQGHHPTLKPEDFDRGLREMKAHAYKAPRSDWNAAFRNWMNNSVKFGSNGRSAGQREVDSTKAAMSGALEILKRQEQSRG